MTIAENLDRLVTAKNSSVGNAKILHKFLFGIMCY